MNPPAISGELPTSGNLEAYLYELKWEVRESAGRREPIWVERPDGSRWELSEPPLGGKRTLPPPPHTATNEIREDHGSDKPRHAHR